MRITITEDEYEKIQAILLLNDLELHERLHEEFVKSTFSCTSKKITATKKANIIKRKKSKEAVMNAINILRLENRPITVYSVSKAASISYNTAKNYEDFIITQQSALFS